MNPPDSEMQPVSKYLWSLSQELCKGSVVEVVHKFCLHLLLDEFLLEDEFSVEILVAEPESRHDSECVNPYLMGNHSVLSDN